MNLEKIRQIARDNGWAELDHQENISMVSFMHAQRRINVYYTKMTVATCIDHPKRGKTQLFRRNVWDEKMLHQIFNNPRQHTGRGYYTR